MPFGKWKDFDACVADFIGQGKDEESAKKICGALRSRLGKESFSWVGSIDLDSDGGNLIRGKAIHPTKTFHPEDWETPVCVYLEEELGKAAHGLAGRPLFLDHLYPVDGKVLGAEYEDGAVEYVAELNDERVLDWIRDGTLKHCSIQYDWSSLTKVDGVAPRGIEFDHLALLKNLQPGDTQTTVEIWEGIMQRIREARGLSLEAEWDAEYTNNLPDDAFAYIEPGGEKDDHGKTKPRSLRHFPYKNAQGQLDRDHIVNGLARLGQDLSEWATANAKTLIREKLCAAAKSWNEQHETDEISSEICDVGSEEGSVKELQDRITTLTEERDSLHESLKKANDRIGKLEKEKESLTQRLGEAVIEPQKAQEDLKQAVLRQLREAVFERVPTHWGYGPCEQNRRVKALIERLEET